MTHCLPVDLLRLVGEYAVDSVEVLYTLMTLNRPMCQALRHPNLVSHFRIRFFPGLLSLLKTFAHGVKWLDFGETTTDEDLGELKLLSQPCEINLSDCYFVTGETFSCLPLNVHTLKLSCCRSLQDGGLLAVRQCTQLTRLEIQGCPQISDLGLRVIERLPLLKFLDLGGCSKLTDSTIFRHLEDMRVLKLTYCHRVVDFTFLECMPHLEFLDASWCSSVTDGSLASLSRAFNLLYLNLRGCFRLTDTGLNHIRNLNLTLLNLSGCMNLTLARVLMPTTLHELYASDCENVRTLDAFSNLNQLRALHLDDCTHIDHIQALAPLSKLQLLDLTGCNRISRLDVLTGMHDLAELRLTNCVHVSDLTPLSELKKLHTLYLQECALTDDSLAILSHLPRLVDLNLLDCRQITDKGLASLSSLTEMRRLDLTSCCNLTDAGLESLASLVHLEELSVSNCQGLCDFQVLYHLQTLHTLKIADCALSFRGMEAISSLSGLKMLALSGAGDINDDALILLSRLSLERLDLEQFSGITEVGLHKLLWGLESLHTLYVTNCVFVTDIAMPMGWG